MKKMGKRGRSTPPLSPDLIDQCLSGWSCMLPAYCHVHMGSLYPTATADNNRSHSITVWTRGHSSRCDTLHPNADEEEITSPGNRFARHGVPEDVVCGYRLSRRAAFHAETAAECAHVLNEPHGDASLADTIPE